MVETVTTGRAKRSTAGNRMRELLEKAHKENEDDALFAEDEDDAEFAEPQEQKDVYLEEFADTDDEVDDEEDEEKALQQEERRKNKSKPFNPLVKATRVGDWSTLKPRESDLALLDPAIDIDKMAPSTLILEIRKQRREAKRNQRSETRRSNLRASTLKSEQELIDKERAEKEALANSRKGRKAQHETGEVRGARPMTQDELIAAALEEEERNKEALTDWLRKEEERRELRRVGRKRVRGPRWTWISRTVGKLVEVVGEEGKEEDDKGEGPSSGSAKEEPGAARPEPIDKPEAPVADADKPEPSTSTAEASSSAAPAEPSNPPEKAPSPADASQQPPEAPETGPSSTQATQRPPGSTEDAPSLADPTQPPVSAETAGGDDTKTVTSGAESAGAGGPAAEKTSTDNGEKPEGDLAPAVAPTAVTESSPATASDPPAPAGATGAAAPVAPTTEAAPTTQAPSTSDSAAAPAATAETATIPLTIPTTTAAATNDTAAVPSTTAVPTADSTSAFVKVPSTPAPAHASATPVQNAAPAAVPTSDPAPETAAAADSTDADTHTGQYTRNYLILSQVPGGLPAEISLILGNHVDWSSVQVIPARNRPINRRPPIDPLCGQPARYRHPESMVPYTNVESFKTLEAVLAGRYVWSEAGWWAGGEADAFADGVEDIPGWREAVSRRWLGGQEIKEEVPEVPEEPVEEVVEVMEVEEEPVEEEKPKSRKSGSGAKANNRKRKADDEPPVPALKKSRSKSKSKRRR